jgi:hypothetical protein
VSNANIAFQHVRKKKNTHMPSFLLAKKGAFDFFSFDLRMLEVFDNKET